MTSTVARDTAMVGAHRGAGLAIVAKLVHCDDDEVHLEAAPGGGLAAIVRYPVG